MLIDNLILYEKGTVREINRPNSDLYYFFDYDDRTAESNMDFQHFHRFYEIHLLLDRESNHIIEGALFPNRPLDLTLLSPSKLHKSQYPEGPAVKRLVVNFRIPGFSEPQLTQSLARVLSVFDAPVPIYRFERPVQEQLAAHLNAIFRLLTDGSDSFLLDLNCEFIRFLSCIYENRDRNLYHLEQNTDTLTSKIYDVAAYIHSHYSEDLSLQKLSREFFISTYYLSHQFRAITGFNLTTYVQMTRIRNAQQMLLSGNLKIAEIAAACGFNSFSQFNRVFHKFCGVSPSQMKSAAESKAYTEYRSVPILIRPS